MKKENIKIKCPKHILFGDPMYFEDYRNDPEKLQKLVGDYRPQPGFKAGVSLVETEHPEYPGFIARTMTIYFAPEQYLPTYMGGKMYASQKIDRKEIGVDTACYLIEVDGRYEDIKTGGDGYWGDYQELYREINGKKFIDAVVISIAMPDEQSFEGMKHLAEHFFEDISQDKVPKKADKKKERGVIEITQAESQRKMEIARNAIADMLSNMERVTVAGLVRKTGLSRGFFIRIQQSERNWIMQ